MPTDLLNRRYREDRALERLWGPISMRDVRSHESDVLHPGIGEAPHELRHDLRAHELQVLRPRRRVALHGENAVGEGDGMAWRAVSAPATSVHCSTRSSRELRVPPGLAGEVGEHVAETLRVAAGSERRSCRRVVDGALASAAARGEGSRPRRRR
jgi:hypothetical protein